MDKNEKKTVPTDGAQMLAEAFLSLSDVDECLAFFGDLLTVKEIEELSSRLEVARLLKSGENYMEIASRTGASTATISRVSKCLSGELGGYRMVLSRLDAGEVPESDVIRIDSLTEEQTEAVRAVLRCFRSK